MDSKPKNPEFEKLVSVMPQKGDIGRQMAQQLVDGVVSGRITLDSIRGTVEQESRKTEAVINFLLDQDVSDAQQAVDVLDTLIQQGLFGRLRQAYDQGDVRVIEKLNSLFESIASISYNTADPERTVEEAYLASFRFDSFCRRLYWERMRKNAAQRGYEKWRGLFDFILRAENQDPEAWALIRGAQEAISKIVSPPLDSVHNYEVAVINYSRFYKRNDALGFCYLSAFKGKQLKSAYALAEFRGFYGKPAISTAFQGDAFMEYCYQWEESGFARIEIGHKLAAALCLTDIPEPVESPWKCWSLVVPSGIFPLRMEASQDRTVDTEIERFWCKGSSIVAVVYQIKGSNVRGMDDVDDRKTIIVPDSFEKMNFGEATSEMKVLYNNLVRGVCLCVTEKGEQRKGGWGTPSHGGQKTKKSSHPVVSGERYVIGKPVSIDLREELSKIISGERGSRSSSSPRFQFLVRGHWRNQPHGPGRSQYRRQWIEPYWKGNEETRTLLRTYEIKKD